jgi:hypothetical protein
VLRLIVVPLPPGKSPFAVKINNDYDRNSNSNNNNSSPLLLSGSVAGDNATPVSNRTG